MHDQLHPSVGTEGERTNLTFINNVVVPTTSAALAIETQVLDSLVPKVKFVGEFTHKGLQEKPVGEEGNFLVASYHQILSNGEKVVALEILSDDMQRQEDLIRQNSPGTIDRIQQQYPTATSTTLDVLTASTMTIQVICEELQIPQTEQLLRNVNREVLDNVISFWM